MLIYVSQPDDTSSAATATSGNTVRYLMVTYFDNNTL